MTRYLIPTNVPRELRNHLFAPVRVLPAQGKRGLAGKTDKIPYHPKRQHGISTHSPRQWMRFDEAVALAALDQAKTPVIGMLIQPGVVCIDLDNVVQPNGTLSSWAEGVVKQMDSWAEVSPSGRGLHIWAFADEGVGFDFVGDLREDGSRMEVYLGSAPRHVTLTGHTVLARPCRRFTHAEVDDLCRHNARKRPVDQVISDVPDLLDEDELPDPASMELNNEAYELLIEHRVPEEDVSSFLVKVCKSLHANRVTSEQMLSLLWYAPEVADWLNAKRPCGVEAQMEYLWKWQVLTAFEYNAPVPSSAVPELFQVEGDPEDLGLNYVEPAPSVPLGDAPLSDAVLADGAMLGFGDLDEEEPEGAGELVSVTSVKAARGYATLDEILASARGPITDQWIIQDVITRGGVTILGGAPGAGKSFMALDIGLRVAADMRWGSRLDGNQGLEGFKSGMPVHQGVVVYILAEAPGTLAPRTNGWVIHNQVDTTGVPFLAITMNTQREANAGKIDIGSKQFQQKLVKKLGEIERDHGKLALVILDTFRASAPGVDENSSNEVGPLMGMLEKLASDLNTGMLVVAHTGKNKGSGLRGSNALDGGCDQVLIMGKEYKPLVKGGTPVKTWSLRIEKSRTGRFEGTTMPVAMHKVLTGRLTQDEDLTPEEVLVVGIPERAESHGQDSLGEGESEATPATPDPVIEREALVLPPSACDGTAMTPEDMEALVLTTIEFMCERDGWHRSGVVAKPELVGASLQRVPPWVDGVRPNEVSEALERLLAADDPLVMRGPHGGYMLTAII